MSFQPQVDTLTYELYFGLNEKPFSLNADPRFIYDSPTYVAARDSLLAGIRRREGLLVVTGEVGTGKSTLCRSVLRELGRKTYSSLVPDPFASREDLLKMLLIDFGVLSIQELTAGPLRGASRTELGYLLSEFIESLPPDAFIVVLIDEAQNLSLPLIEETRILSDTFGAKGRLQIVFVGQPELDAKLKLPEMRQVDQRVCGYHRLAPLSREAVAGYIQHRLQAAGAQRDRVLFPPAIIDALHQRSGGVPRLINRICDRALQIASERQADSVNKEILDAALLTVGSVTLSQTSDSIGVAAAPAQPASASARDNSGQLRRHLAAAPSGREGGPQASESDACIDEHEDLRKQFASWLEQDLVEPSRSLPPLDTMLPDDLLALEPSPAPEARKEASRARALKNDWPRDMHSETYMQSLRRKWGKRAAIAVAAFVGLNAAVMGASLLIAALEPPVPPAAPKAPAAVVAGISLPEAPVADAPVVEPAAVAAAPAAPAAPAAVVSAPAAVAAPVAGSKEYLVAVGIFADRERADRLVESLTQAGLPAMQRPFQFRQQQVQQIVLGPFFSRSDADRDLRRLQGLGGHGDARLVAGSQ